MPTETLHPTTTKPLQQLAQAYGLELGFIDAFGDARETPEVALAKVLHALGAFPAENDEDCRQRLAEYEEQRWAKVLPAMIVLREDQVVPIRVQLPYMPKNPLSWKITEENGETVHTGEVQLSPMNKVEEKSFERRRLIFTSKDLYFAWHWHFEAPLPLGYHTLELFDKEQKLAKVKLAMTPAKAYTPPEMQTQQLWGATSQLYSLKSDQNYGMGDTRDIKALIQDMAKKGCATIGLNPMHQLFPHNPGDKSPYSPSSRYFLNWLYIHPQNTEEFQKSEEAQRLLKEAEGAIQANRDKEMVDYVETARLKRPILEALYQQFAKELAADSPRAKAYLAYVASKGDTLVRLAQYEALCEDFYKKDESLWGWPVWPEAFQDCNSVEVKSACVRLQDRVRFFMYLQFLMHEQLEDVKQTAIDAGMPIGLYLDLAVGTSLGSADVWMNRDLYSLGASVGCPPDVFNMLGQNWGLPPMKPDVLKDQGFEAFITLLRANMNYAGALRIDHALAIFRAFWIPPGETGQNGAYVKYPAQEMLGLIALESQRNKCLVIGEDLGTVPDWVREALQERDIFSYRIYYFERGEGNRYLRPDEYPEKALVAISTHDLPTLQGFWTGQDIELRRELNLFPNDEKMHEEYNNRPLERQHLLDSLIHNGLMPEGYSHNQADYEGELPEPVARAVDAFLAQTPCKLRVHQLEDMLGVQTQMNMPGTVDENPNWQRKLPLPVEQLAGKFQAI